MKDIVFDMDGVLINSEVKYQELFMQLGASNVSKDAFISYFMTILPYGALARVFTCDTSLDKYFEKINYMFSQDIPCALAIKYLEMLVHNQDIEINENLSYKMIVCHK